MRRFLIEMETEVTLEEIREDYNKNRERIAEESGAENFGEYLENCMYWNNGALTEILTDDTPRDLRKRAVRPCKVLYEGDDEWCERYLHYGEMRDLWESGAKIQLL